MSKKNRKIAIDTLAAYIAIEPNDVTEREIKRLTKLFDEAERRGHERGQREMRERAAKLASENAFRAEMLGCLCGDDIRALEIEAKDGR